jgi:hypothetical protein
MMPNAKSEIQIMKLKSKAVVVRHMPHQPAQNQMATHQANTQAPQSKGSDDGTAAAMPNGSSS